MTEVRWEVVTRILRHLCATQFVLGLILLATYVVLEILAQGSRSGPWSILSGGVGGVLLGAGGVGLIGVYSLRRSALRPVVFGCETVLQVGAHFGIALIAGDQLLGGPLWDSLSGVPTGMAVPSGLMILAALALSLESPTTALHLIQRVVAGSLALLGAAFLIVMVCMAFGLFLPNSATAFFVIWAVASLVGVGVLPALIRRAERPRGRLIRTLPRRIKLTHTCPGCSEWIESRPGPARCDWCGLRMLIDVAEPRCACGYLLYELQGETCPECGRPIEDTSTAAATPA
jgi:hypothetical protein